jgi:hypothetical protein
MTTGGFGMRVPAIDVWARPRSESPAIPTRLAQPRPARPTLCLARISIAVFIDGQMPDVSAFQPVSGPGQSGVTVSTALQQYQATSDRYGRNGSPSGSSCFGVGIGSTPNMRPKPLRTP